MARRKTKLRIDPITATLGGIVALAVLIILGRPVLTWMLANWVVTILLLMVAAAGFIVFLVRRRPERRQRRTNEQKMREWDDLAPPIFVKRIGELMRIGGFTEISLVLPEGGDDRPPDILALDRAARRVVLRCEQYVNINIGPKVVREFNADLEDVYDAEVGIMVTNRHFTEGAVPLARDWDIVAINREDLGSWLATGVMPHYENVPIVLDVPEQPAVKIIQQVDGSVTG